MNNTDVGPMDATAEQSGEAALVGYEVRASGRDAYEAIIPVTDDMPPNVDLGLGRFATRAQAWYAAWCHKERAEEPERYKTKGVRMVVWFNFDVPADVDERWLTVEFANGIQIMNGQEVVRATNISFSTEEVELDDESRCDDDENDE